MSTAGGTQALQRTDVAAVTVGRRRGFVRRPNLVGAPAGKAAAHTNASDQDRRRRRRDFLVLVGLVTAADFANEGLSKKSRQRLRVVIAALEKDGELAIEVTDAVDAIRRLRLATGLD